MFKFLRVLALLAPGYVIGESMIAPLPPSLNDFGLPGVQETHSSLDLGAGRLGMGMSVMGAQDVTMLEDARLRTSGGNRAATQLGASWSRLFLAAGLLPGWDMSLSLPFYSERIDGLPGHGNVQGAGDLAAIARYRLPWNAASLAFSVQGLVTLPTSGEGGLIPKELIHHPADGVYPHPNLHPFGSSIPLAGMSMGGTWDAGRRFRDLLLHVNFQAERPFVPAYREILGMVRGTAAAEIRVTRALRAQAEFRKERLVTGALDWDYSQGEAAVMGLGLVYAAHSGLSFRLGAQIAPQGWNPYSKLILEGPRAAAETLAYRRYAPGSIFVAVSWAGFPFRRDHDKDGFLDNHDLCPWSAEDKDGFLDQDGCPEPDNDLDGLADVQDRCPNISEDWDGFEDSDGCPEIDNDHDGIRDTADACPNDAEDSDGFEDRDGCPDFDNDKDGIPDASDRCPGIPESKNGVEDADGCPERDGDRDGVPDDRDSCLREAEIINFYKDADGCPDEKPEPIRNGILPGVVFVMNSAELKPPSYPVLENLAERLVIYPGTEVEIVCYMDPRDGPEAQALSLARAKAVAEFLAHQGVEARRLVPVGAGGTHPMAESRTAKGRELNRRIEIRRLN